MPEKVDARSEALSRAVLAATPDLIFRIDRDGVFLDYVPARGMGPYVPEHEFLGRRIRDVLPEIAEEAMEKVTAALETGLEQTHEYSLPFDGVERAFESRLVPADEESVIAIVRDVTEQRATAERLRQSEERFRSVVQTAGDIIVLLAPDGAILEFNQEAERLFKRERASVLGRNYFELFIPEEHRAAILADVEKVLAGTPTRGYVNPVAVTEASGRILSWNVDRLLDGWGDPVGIIACGHDITFRRRLEASVFSIAGGLTSVMGEEFFQHFVRELAEILEADVVMVGELDEEQDDHIRTIARRVFGESMPSIVYPLAGSPCETVVGKAICSYREGVFALFPDDVALKRDGIEGYVGAPLFDSHDRPMGLITVLYRAPIPDVPLVESVLRVFATRAANELERKHAEEELKASERLNRDIVESMPGGILRLSSDGAIVQANENAQEFLDLSFDELKGRFTREWAAATLWEDGTPYPASDYPGVRCLDTGMAQSPRVIGFRQPDKPTKWGLFTAVPIRGTDGKSLEGAVVMFVDITKRKAAESERRRLETQMQHAQKLESLGVLAGGIAHDFNNLLTGILGNASLALTKLPADADVRVNLTRVERAAKRAAELTNQMLAYAGKGSFVIRMLSLNEVVRELVPLLGTSLSKKVELDLSLESDLPYIEADRSQIEQVVMNLVTNAADAIADKEGTIRIRTESSVNRDNLYLEVADDGCGMDAETRDRIFDPFFTTKFTGRGLGLAAVEGIIRGHRGSVRVDSRPDDGTTFRIRLPAAPETAHVEKDSVVPPLRNATGTILVIDDEETVRDVVEAALTAAGYGVLLAQDGLDGVACFRRHQKTIDAVVVDVSMPRMNGEETIERILALRPDARVLLTSGYTEQEAKQRFRDRAIRGFIQKPFRAQELVEKINAFVRQS